MYYIGLDPGKAGGYAIIHKNRKSGEFVLESCGDFDRQTVVTILSGLSRMPEQTICCIEKVHSMPKQGVASTFSFGQNFGWMKGVLDALHIPYQEIPPQRWKKEFGLNSDKEKSVDVCYQLFPKAELIPPNCRKPHDGIAESVLMAEYARRKLDVPSFSAFDEEHWD